jgi:hypothetical protein
MKIPHINLGRTLHVCLAFVSLVLISGCASYHLGSPAELPFDSIYIRPTGNESFAPQAQAVVSAQIREAFIRDGRVKLVSKQSEADAVLEVMLTNYDRRAAARSRSDTVSARDFDLLLAADISLLDQNKGDYLFAKRSIVERSSTYVENPYAAPADLQTQGYIQSEYNAMPRLARDLARRIADEVLSPW